VCLRIVYYIYFNFFRIPELSLGSVDRPVPENYGRE
jgi:hypothetical protein